MLFISNTGKAKTVKSSIGRLVTIPPGNSSQIDDPALQSVAKTNRDLKLLTKDEFYKSTKQVPMKKKVDDVVKQKKEESEKKAAAVEKKKKTAAKKSEIEKKKKTEKAESEK